MKRLVSTVLALSLLGTAAASAQPFRGNNDRDYTRGNDRGYSRDYRSGSNWNRGHDNSGTVIGLGLGLFALAAILSSQQRTDTSYQRSYDNRYDDRYDTRYDGYYGR